MVDIAISGPAKLDGQVALLTGAAGGIGSEVARTLAAAGATVIATDISQAHPFAGVANIHYQRYDVTSAEDTDRIVRQVVGDHG
jgi:3-oxoacyl-[acyl-carrier protein] reductase